MSGSENKVRGQVRAVTLGVVWTCVASCTTYIADGMARSGAVFANAESSEDGTPGILIECSDTVIDASVGEDLGERSLARTKGRQGRGGRRHDFEGGPEGRVWRRRW